MNLITESPKSLGRICDNDWSNAEYYKFKRKADDFNRDEMKPYLKGMKEINALVLPGTTWEWEIGTAVKFSDIKFSFMGLEREEGNWKLANKAASNLPAGFQMYYKPCSLYEYLFNNKDSKFDLCYIDGIGQLNGNLLKSVGLIAHYRLLTGPKLLLVTTNRKQIRPPAILDKYVRGSAIALSGIVEPYPIETYKLQETIIPTATGKLPMMVETRCKLNWDVHVPNSKEDAIAIIEVARLNGVQLECISILPYGTTENPKTSVMTQFLFRQL